jgi:hypothetical protein
MGLQDITGSVKQAAAALPMGGMIHSTDFSLDEAMSAIELMEPKMDAGCDLEAKQAKLKAAKLLIQSTSLSGTTASRIADILIDQVLLWLSGHLYIQTVHASLFVTERESLPNKDLCEFTTILLRVCRGIRAYMQQSGICDEEDFLGHMFGFNEDVAVIGHDEKFDFSSSSLRRQCEFLVQLQRLLDSRTLPFESMEAQLSAALALAETLQSRDSETLSPQEQETVHSCVDPSMHRNLLPPGPPRVVPNPRTSAETYAAWSQLLKGIRAAVVLMEKCESQIDLIQRLSQLRRHEEFPAAFLRAFVFLRCASIFPSESIGKDWLATFCGGSLSPFMKSFKDETEAFVSDFTMVINRTVHTLLRSPSRQHRSLKSNLSDFCILQHRAWSLNSRFQSTGDSGFNPRGLWMLSCLIACMLVELNLLLSIELDLVDLTTTELPLIMFLMEAPASVRVYLLNDMLGLMRTGGKSIKPQIANELRRITLVAATEHSFIDCAFRSFVAFMMKTQKIMPVPDEALERLFELRSIPLQAFPLPKNVSLDEFLERVNNSESSGAEECLQWIERTTQLVQGPKGVVLGSDISLVKKTVLNNKLMLLKVTDQAKLMIKHHPVVPCIVP